MPDLHREYGFNYNPEKYMSVSVDVLVVFPNLHQAQFLCDIVSLSICFILLTAFSTSPLIARDRISEKCTIRVVAIL
jgi:hypothetical protein